MKQFFKNIYEAIKEFFNGIYNSIYIRRLKNKAMNLHYKTGRQYHLVPSGDDIVIVDNKAMKEYNKRVKRKVSHLELLKIAYFSTPSQRIIKNITLWEQFKSKPVFLKVSLVAKRILVKVIRLLIVLKIKFRKLIGKAA